MIQARFARETGPVIVSVPMFESQDKPDKEMGPAVSSSTFQGSPRNIRRQPGPTGGPTRP